MEINDIPSPRVSYIFCLILVWGGHTILHESRMERHIKSMGCRCRRTRLVTGLSHMSLFTVEEDDSQVPASSLQLSLAPDLYIQLLSGYSLLDASQATLMSLVTFLLTCFSRAPHFDERYHHLSIAQARNLGFILSSSTSNQSSNSV